MPQLRAPVFGKTGVGFPTLPHPRLPPDAYFKPVQRPVDRLPGPLGTSGPSVCVCPCTQAAAEDRGPRRPCKPRAPRGFAHMLKAHRPMLIVRGPMPPMMGAGEGLGLLENWLGCTLPESQQEGGLSVGAVGPQGASRWRDYPRRRVRARSFAH